MARALSNKNICDAKFDVAEFTGRWLESFGKPELRGAWIIYGESGSGKTHFALEMVKYISRFVNRVAYDTLEQGKSKSFQNAWIDAGMADIGSKIIVYPKSQIAELRDELKKRKSPDVIVIDSISALVGFTKTSFLNLINDFPDKLFIFIAHAENRRPDPKVAQHVRKLSEVKAYVEGFKAFITTRFCGDDGEGGSDFLIWEKGADDYWVDKM